jgi:hypothetical protein
MKQNYIRMFAIFASILMLTIVAVPMVAAEYEYCDEMQSPTTDITLYDFCGAEIEIINEMPFIVAEIEDEYINIPLSLSDTKDMMANGVSITVEVNGNYLLIPTEEGIERTCISEFDVNIIDGQLILVHEMNPLFTIGLALLIAKYGATALGGKSTAALIGAAAGAGLDAAIIDAIVRHFQG